MFSKNNEDDDTQLNSAGGEQDTNYSDEIEALKAEIEEQKKKVEDYENHWKRTMADFQNYKKRQGELFGELVGAANQELILALLPIFDTFCLAVNYVPEDIKDTDWAKGVVQIKAQLADLLRSKGLEEIKSVGEKFDPSLHEAVEMVDSDKPEGMILEEVQKGYKLNGAVIRTAKVKVATLRR